MHVDQECLARGEGCAVCSNSDYISKWKELNV